MEASSSPLKYNGTIAGYYPIFLKNLLLNIVTLGIYSAWATTRNRQYFIGHTEFLGQQYKYDGTGVELFIGRIKALGILIVLVVIYTLLTVFFEEKSEFIIVILTLLYIFSILALVPIAIVGALKYRLSRIAWNSIRHTFNENYRNFIAPFLKGVLMSIVTLGLYAPFFMVTIWRFAFDNSKMGDQSFSFTGNGAKYFKIALKGFFFIPLTLGIYSFWYLANVWNYVINSVALSGKSFSATISAGDVFNLVFPNILILVFTFGLGWPIVITRIYTFFAEKIGFDPDFDANTIKPGPLDMETATGEGLGFLLELDL